MATGHFYKQHDDAGAPTMAHTAGDMIAMLDWALDVSGAVYWEKVYTGTNKAVYRSKTGLRPYLRVDDTNGEWAELQMFESMTDVDTGTGQCPDGVNQISNLKCPKGDSSEPSVYYYIVGDSEYFLVVSEADATYRQYGPNNVRCWGFGEVASYLAVDSYPCVLFGARDGTGGSDYNDLTGSLMGSTSMGSPVGSISDNGSAGDPNSSHLYWLKTADGVSDSSGGYAWAINWSGMYHRMSAENPFFYSPFYIQCSNGAISGSSTYFWGYANVDATMRGRLPYLYSHNAIPHVGNNGPVTEDTVTVGASEFINILSYEGSTSLNYSNSRQWMLRTTDDEPDRP